MNNEPRRKPVESAEPQTEAHVDPFDPARLALSQDFASSVGVKKVLLAVPVRKPSKEWHVRTHPSESYRLQTVVLELKEDREVYLVDRSLWPELSNESTISPRALITSMTRQGDLFIWPIRLPGPEGRLDQWSRTLCEAATLAAEKWVRVVANMSIGGYEAHVATSNIPAPEWPDLQFSQLLKIAFKDRFIETLDHPVLRKLRGEV